MKDITLSIARREGSEDMPLPGYATPGSSGMDLYADLEGEERIQPGEIRCVSTGLYVSIPEGFEAQIRPRSGLALKHGIGLVNAPGTIDSDYRGLIRIILINMGKNPYTIKRGDRIAQMVIQEVVRARIEVLNDLDRTARAAGGFGHTGR